MPTFELRDVKNLQSSDDIVKLWSQYFPENATPTKIKYVKTNLSPVKERMRGLLRSIGSFVGLSAVAVWYVFIFD